MGKRTFWSDADGQSLVELSLLLPLLVFGLIGGTDMGRGYAVQVAVQNAARAGAEAASLMTAPTQSAAQSVARAELNRTPGVVAANATVTGKLDLGDAGRLTGSVTANSATGFDNARVQYDLNRPNLNLSAYATANRNGMESVGGSVVYRPNDNLTLSAGVNHNFQTDHTTASAEAAWKVNKDVDFALSASHDSQGDSRIGAGVRIRF